MTFLVLFGIVAVLFGLIKLVKNGAIGEEISDGLEQRIRINEMKAEAVSGNGSGSTGAGISGEQSSPNSGVDNMNPDTIGLMSHVLVEMGCQPVDNKDGSLSVMYQGENFVMEFGGFYARIWDPSWSAINVNDPDFPRFREAVNAYNFNFGPKVVYTHPNEEGLVMINSTWDILMMPTIPEKKDYISMVFKQFFRAKEQLHATFASLAQLEQQTKKAHRPVGFATDDTATE